ncbi:ferritin-like protein [Flavobacterium piscisymbiosum]|uniref:Ferritin-like protein n=1 Tax=Flavobacterium piscisymbiosum TaxID=2893753 RepID=A0ABS8MIJ5_9FLAO|nr:ferritin-like protein [Flavobacterium sp. F-30]MCC9065318.1 ferritin-like protein [Flavobacterium sp. F-30]
MKTKKLFTFSDTVTKENIKEVMQQAIALELATIPTYLSTYYSINRAQDQDVLYAKIHAQLSQSGKTPAEIDALAQELKVDVLVYSNKAAALIMSVVIEEMLHLALACNVKQAVCQTAPDLMGIGKILSFPTQLDGHIPEFQINAAKLSLNQLTTFLQIESPEPFEDPYKDKQLLSTIEYHTIGKLYELIIKCVKEDFPGPYNYRPQLLPPDDTGRARPFYSQNSMNTVHYDREHNPQFANEDESGGLLGVYDANSAVEALERIIEQGEGKSTDQQHVLKWGKNKMPVPMDIVDGKAVFWKGDYDDTGKELAHFAKFLEAYTFGGHYQEKFRSIQGLDDFFSYFVYNTDANPQTADYTSSGNHALALCSELGNAVFAYILLMIEACYYKDESTQYDLFMYGIHKSMIWLLSGVGNQINKYPYTKGNTSYQGALTFEPYSFEQSSLRPKAQIMNLVDQLAKADPNWKWAIDPKYDNYFPALPDVGLDYSIVADVPKVPSTPYTHHS